MVRKLQDIYELTAVGTNAAAGWLAAWLVALVVLTAIPYASAAPDEKTAGTGIYYTFAAVTTMYPDLNSGLSVQVRSLRPVVGR